MSNVTKAKTIDEMSIDVASAIKCLREAASKADASGFENTATAFNDKADELEIALALLLDVYCMVEYEEEESDG